jgi:uncharacterized protein YbbC (DUF1343 family)
MQTHRWGSPLILGLVLTGCAAGAPPAVRPGIDVLLDDSLHLVGGRRVGLLTNHAGVDANGVDDVTRLREAGVQLTALFSPEHGFRAQLDVENIDHGVDSATGLPIYSLYGTVRAPTPEMLAGIEVLLVDLPDIGGRPYTYVTTALEALRAAREDGVRVVVLDRPNPIGGLAQGPVLDTAFRSDIGMLPVPLRHGMTLGELVRMGNDVLGIGGALVVVPAAGWRRSQWLDQTRLPWVRPSPSMPDLESATHYPGLVLFEATNLSVGRGTPIAFQVIAGPWLDVTAVRQSVEPIDGAVLADTSIVPVAPPDAKYAGVAIPALRLRVTDRERYDPVATAVRLLTAVRARHADSLRIVAARFDKLAGTDRVRLAVESGAEAGSVVAGWEAELSDFRARRAGYSLYPPELP